MTTEIAIDIQIKSRDDFELICELICNNINRDTAEFDKYSFLTDLQNIFSK